MNRHTWLLLAGLALTPISLTADVANGGFNLTQDPEKEVRTYKVGDLVEVAISESSQSSYRESASGSKSAEMTAKLEKWVRLSKSRTHRDGGGTKKVTKLKPSALNEPEIDLSTGQNFENESQDSRTSTFVEKVMCMIKEVRPNGNVYVEGTKEFREDDKYRKLVFSGEISKDDLSSGDAVPSNRVYNPTAEIIERGPHKDAVKRTWFQAFMQVIWPF